MAEPVSLAQAKLHLRIIEDTAEDSLIEALIVAAREWVENHTGQVLVQREVTDTFRSFGTYLELSRRPVLATPAPTVSYIDADGQEQEVASIVASTGRYPYRVYPGSDASWPTTQSNSSVTVTYTAGYEDGDVPQSLVQAMLLLIGAWFSQREAIVVGATVAEAPFAVLALCQSYRSMFL